MLHDILQETINNIEQFSTKKSQTNATRDSLNYAIVPKNSKIVLQNLV